MSQYGSAKRTAHNFVIPREVAESMRRILIHRRMDSASCDFAQDDALRSAQNDEEQCAKKCHLKTHAVWIPAFAGMTA